MRFSAAALVAALPALSVAQENLLDQYVAQFQQILGKAGSYLPLPSKYDPAAAHQAKTGPMKLSVLTLDNWRETLYEPVAPGATTPEEWWVLISGRNKTCFGHCTQAEAAFNETAAKFAGLPKAPHMGVINCDDQPILCNAWSANVGNIWAFDMLPEPAAIDIYKKRLNLTAVTTEDIVKLHKAGNKQDFILLDSWFHPFNGKASELGLSVPFGYLLWVFNLLPNWMFMLIVSFASRSMMYVLETQSLNLLS
ncbi:hypothetical protein Trco_005875 [Trichoderma cornu-damae]|uniref:Peptidyl-tRNA hydrolase n=1 Tax=Trichoderma cornu-damae TaxID=654480 RepID=A0A9P8QQE8_9HYPO|nr:hypothetical protein Trco_005875 [Trichoderma cornu-damae]